MDIVYVLKNEPSDWQDNEIRYSLRSLERFGRNYDRVFLVGGKPDFLDYNKIIHLAHQDKYAVPDYNVFLKLIYACSNSDISENFVLFNDDFYLLRYISLRTIPYYYKREEISTIYGNKNTFNDTALLTREFLLKYNKPIFDFKPHYPIIYNKTKLQSLIPLFAEGFKISPLGLSLRDLYCNWHKVPNKIYKKENKMIGKNVIITRFIKRLDLFSGSNSARKDEKIFLKNKFVVKSKWEI
jgi:hypothetical protein